jgi:acetyltransferase-like isoleucine patch superfamily enzyme
MLEVVLTREDANSEFAVITEWLVADRAEVAEGQPVCVVETSKAEVEIESPGDGVLVRRFEAGAEVELGHAIAVIAESPEELSRLAERPAPRGSRPGGPRSATQKAVELAELHGIDLASIEKRGFVTAEDVLALVGTAEARAPSGGELGILAGISLDGVTLPHLYEAGDRVGVLEPSFLESLLADPQSFRALPSEEKCETYRRHGAEIGREVVLEDGVLLVAPRLVLEDAVRIGAGATVRCEEVFAVGALTHVGPGLEVACRRAFLGAGVHAGRSIRVGGGGHRDPWAILAVGDLTFLGDELFVNPCRPVLIGREVFLTQRAMVVTHNIGHSVLEGFENRFAPVVLEDRAQVGLGSIVYAGCRVGREAIVASNSYVVSDIPAGAFAIGVPARVAGHARRRLARQRQAELARRIVAELAELLALRGHEVATLPEGDGFELATAAGLALVVFVERVESGAELPAGEGGTVVLTLEFAGEEPGEGCAVLDLLARELHGSGGVVLDTVREFCRKKGIRLSPGPWRYRGGLI